MQLKKTLLNSLPSPNTHTMPRPLTESNRNFVLLFFSFYICQCVIYLVGSVVERGDDVCIPVNDLYRGLLEPVGGNPHARTC